jgi:hypothetical protein
MITDLQDSPASIILVRPYKTTKALCAQGFCGFQNNQLHSQGIANTVESIVGLLAKRTYNRDHNNRDERNDDRILDETLTFFFRSK